MASDPEILGDAQSRDENRRFRAGVERRKSENPVYAYAPRWVPSGNWRMTWFDRLVLAFGIAIIAMVLGMRLFGVIGPR